MSSKPPEVGQRYDLPRVAPPGGGGAEPAGPAPGEEVLEAIEEAPALGQVPKGRSFPCGSCGAGLEYKPGTQALECPYCGHRTEIPKCASDVRELSFEQYLSRIPGREAVLLEGAKEVDCPGCGASVEFPPEVEADTCPFCATHIEAKHAHAPTAVIPPNGLLPFSIEEREARTRFVAWTNSRWFAPSDLKRMAVLGQIRGLYVPYWTYDSMTFSFYTGLRGIHYWVTERDSKGNTRQVRRTRWYPVSGRVDQFFDDVLVCASRGLPAKQTRELEPWDLHKMASFSPDYLSGFRTERYQVGLREGFDEARSIMDGRIRELVRRHIGGDVQVIHTVNTQHEGITFKHILLPVWLATYRYNQRAFRVLVNARTGEVQGERPYSWIKIAIAVVAGLIVIAILAFFLFPLMAEGDFQVSF